jgi:hypothetical protein
MGTEFQEVLCDENGIGGDGEYSGDRVNVFFYEAERNFVNHTRGRKWAKGHLFFSPPPAL